MISRSEEQTTQLGLSLAAQLRPGDVLLLRGELGAGKSVLARAIARGLGVEGPVASPTFTLLNCHEGHVPLYHMDLYRLADADEFYAAGLFEYLGGDGVALVEWPQRAMEAMPETHLDIHILYGPDEEARDIRLTPRGGFRKVAVSP